MTAANVKRSVMARKSVTVKLTPRQAFALLRAIQPLAYVGDADEASRLFSVRSAVCSALYADGWENNGDGSWQKEVRGDG